MIGGGAWFPLTQFKDVSTSYFFLAATDYSGGNVATKIAGKTGYTIWVVSISLTVTTDNAAIQTFQDSSGTPQLVAKTAASPGVVQKVWDFGAKGIALAADKGFQHLMSAAGMAGNVAVTAYMAPTETT